MMAAGGLAVRWVVAGVAAALAGCAPMPQTAEQEQKEAKPIVFPVPPDEPRFVFERTIYSSADVEPEATDEKWRRELTGEGRRALGLVKPYGVAVRQGRIYVSDSAQSSVKLFDVPGGKFQVIGNEDPGMVGQPLGLDLDSAGNLYVVDANERNIKVFDSKGKHLRNIGSQKEFVRPTSVTVDPGGERLYVVDIGGVTSEEHKVKVYDLKTGKHQFDIGKRGKGDGEFNLPRDIAVGPKNGHLYVVDGANFRIQVFNREGKFVKQFGTLGRLPGQFARPKEIATDREGNLYVVDAAFANIQLFDPEGQTLMFIGSRDEREGPAHYVLPSGVAVDDDGRIYVVDQWFAKIEVFRPHAMKADEGHAFRPAKPAQQAKEGQPKEGQAKDAR